MIYYTRLVKTLGFTDLKQIATAIAGYDDNAISTILHGNRQGQLTRFELMLFAALGERFIERHPWRTTSQWFEPRYREYLEKLSEKGIRTSTYDPKDVALSSSTGWGVMASGEIEPAVVAEATSDVPPTPSPAIIGDQ